MSACFLCEYLLTLLGQSLSVYPAPAPVIQSPTLDPEPHLDHPLAEDMSDIRMVEDKSASICSCFAQGRGARGTGLVDELGFKLGNSDDIVTATGDPLAVWDVQRGYTCIDCRRWLTQTYQLTHSEMSLMVDMLNKVSASAGSDIFFINALEGIETGCLALDWSVPHRVPDEMERLVCA